MASSNKNPDHAALPDFHNVGVLTRILTGVIIMQMIAALVRVSSLRDLLQELVMTSAFVEPVLILSLIILTALNGWLRKLRYAFGAALIVTLEICITAAVCMTMQGALGGEDSGLVRALALSAAASIALLAYFQLRERALSPALTEARLQALQARIRPHFLFNSMNAVLSLIRSDPRRAETALEDMAELFRVMLTDNRQLAPLSREVELCRQYLELEQLRLGERLIIEWHIDDMPADALVPPLVLQPLLENAVYHGIEPSLKPGVLSIEIYCRDNMVHALLRNPLSHAPAIHNGNHMAIANIRERLSLHYDAEASLNARETEDIYEVHITLPYMKDDE